MFRLEPHGIENLITFGSENKSIIRSRYIVRQLVSREMEREKIRRRRGGISLNFGDLIIRSARGGGSGEERREERN